MSESAGLFQPFGVDIDLTDGTMQDPDRRLETRASALRGYYRDEAALEELIARDGDPVHYEVYEKEIPEAEGHIRICISKLLPGKIGDEYFMTKGHYHTVLEAAETYLCIAGQGLMLMKTVEGECTWESFQPGRMVYVPPRWAHRSVNTGAVPLVSFCNYPAHAGHNYGDIVEQGFPKRVLDRNGRPAVE